MKNVMLMFLFVFNSALYAEEGCIAVTKDKLCIQFEWLSGPYLGAYSKNVIKFKDLTTSSEENAIYRSPSESVQFFGWMVMPSHTHGTRPVETKILEEGVFENSKIFYMGGMKGTWQFKVKIGTEEFVLHAFDI